MKKILIIGTTNIYGGVGRMIFEFCKNINKEEVHFDFLYYEDASTEERKLIETYGGVFYKVPRYSKNPLKFRNYIKRFYASHKYDIVHVHASTAMLIVYTFPVWKSKNTRIIYHSHADYVSGKVKKVLHCFFRHFIVKYANCKIAVSDRAARFMYGKNTAIILKNGIDTEKFIFDKSIRTEIHKSLGIGKEFLIGHIGRFTYSKNHKFIIEVFEQLYKLNNEVKLLLIGEGEDKDSIREMVKEKGLMSQVIFYGTSNRVQELLCAMDCFIFPSNYEGLGIVAIEAQASGLPVVASTNVPHEAAVTERYRTLSLKRDSAKTWAKVILALCKENYSRKSQYQNVVEAGYDIKDVTKELEKIYEIRNN